MEDLCGVRIICYYPSDIDRILALLRTELDIVSIENTEKRLLPQEFGYRSTHIIAKMKPEWLHVPMHRGLDGIVAEIQIRTVLMHAWADIQHKLAYKSQDQVPEKFQRQLYRLSAKFEEADDQFESLRRDMSVYREEITSAVGKSDVKEIEFNLDVLEGFLAKSFPDLKGSRENAAALFEELKNYGVTFKALNEAVSEMEEVRRELEEARPSLWSREGAARSALEIYSDEYHIKRNVRVRGPIWMSSIARGRELLGKKSLKELQGIK